MPSDNIPVTQKYPGKRPINEALLIWSDNIPLTLRHRGKRHIN